MNFLRENEEKQISNAEKEILNKLSPNLRNSFLLQTLGKKVFSLPLFTKNFSELFLLNVLSIMKPLTFDPDFYLYEVIKNNIKHFQILINHKRKKSKDKKMISLFT